jgi:hypothetical protein
MEGLATAVLYAFCFVWIHVGSQTTQTEFLSAKVLAVFFVGLIVIPLLTCLPLAFVRQGIFGTLQRQASIAAFLPFATLALYALQAIVVWVVTREAYAWIFSAAPIA